MVGEKEVEMKIGAIVSFLILGYVALALAFEIIPEITGLTHAETGIVGVVLDMAIWLIPAAVGVGIILAAVRHFSGKRG